MRFCQIVFVLLTSTVFNGVIEAADYLQKVKPVLQNRCYACHGVLKQEGGLRLDTAQLAKKGAESGIVIQPGQPDASEIVARLTSTDDSVRMPPEGEPLKPDEIAAIRDWISAGATGPDDEKPERDPRDHWAFQKPVRPAVPVVDRADWCFNPIDSFIAATQQVQGLKPQPAAEKPVWLRRVTLDLIGLPPTQKELESFVADASPEAYDTVVNRLLESPHYGERWGRHWMDIWRYSDWWGLGAESRNSQRHIWHWRDWVIESMNADKGYDQMLREMLAADELYPEDTDKLRAGGFLGRQYFKFNRTSWLDETIEHTAKSMLGLTFNCAKCHDHKYDPFTQADYYRLRAIFEPYQVRHDATGGHVDFDKDGIPRPFDCNLDAKTYLHIRGDDRNPDTSKVMEPAFPAFLSHEPAKIEPVTLPAVAVHPGLRPFVTDAYLKQADQQIATKRAELEAAQKRMNDLEQHERLIAEERSKNTDAVAVSDSFAEANAELWDRKSGNWTYAEGKLQQTQQEATPAVMRLKKSVPADFEATVKFIPLEGQVWKSVGLTFDGPDSDDLIAYLSAYASGSKSQIGYKKADYTYPAEAAKLQAIDLNKLYSLTVRVRGSLLNLYVNDELRIAYQLPVERKPSAIQLMTYDCKADFVSFELHELTPSVKMVEPPKEGKPLDLPWTVQQGRLSVAIADKSLEWAMAQPDSIRARSKADHANAQPTASDDAVSLARQAALSEKQLALLKAEEAVNRANLEVARAPFEKKAELETKLTAATTALEAARKAVDDPGQSFTPLRGASKVLESNLETEDSRLKPFPATSTGRRTALAKWITDPQHPLTARVAVNHLWARHFGRPLVATVFDFGRKGALPTHPELLDWLALELIEGGQGPNAGPRWGMKHIHRLIVTSNTYRMTSSRQGAFPHNLTQDPENRYYWRMNPIRMESQVVRDSLLSLAGELDLTMGGPPIEVTQEMGRRRGIYFFHSNIQRERFLSMFDEASVLDCYRRAESIVPQQALALENSPLATEMAKRIVDQILAGKTDMSDTEFARSAFRTILSVEPTDDERSLMTESMNQMKQAAQRANRPNPELQAKIGLIQAILNHNDFVTVR